MGGAELGGVAEGEMVVGLYCMRECIFNLKGRKKKNGQP